MRLLLYKIMSAALPARFETPGVIKSTFRTNDLNNLEGRFASAKFNIIRIIESTIDATNH